MERPDFFGNKYNSGKIKLTIFLDLIRQICKRRCQSLPDPFLATLEVQHFASFSRSVVILDWHRYEARQLVQMHKIIITHRMTDSLADSWFLKTPSCRFSLRVTPFTIQIQDPIQFDICSKFRSFLAHLCPVLKAVKIRTF